MQTVQTSPRLADVRYEIRGALARHARKLDAEGRQILHLNIGNMSRFGFHPPQHIISAIQAHVVDGDGYEHEQGLIQAREAVVRQQQQRGVAHITPERVFVGNGVSELIDVSLRAFLTPGDEVLLPSPDYPLWSASTTLNGGKPVYYPCRAENDHVPDPDELAQLITDKTRAIVIINPNNPTGAMYPRAVLEKIVALAAEHQLLILSDEIYDNLIYDDAPFYPIATLAGDVPCITMGGLSKVHRACGYRVGWMILSGPDAQVAQYRDALQLMAALRLCSNVPVQWGVQPALEGPDTTKELTAPGGRLYRSRQAVLDGVANSRFLDVVKPKGALYAFVRIKPEALPRFDDNDFALKLVDEESILVTPGSSFNEPSGRFVRLTLLPAADVLGDVIERMEKTLERMA